MPSNRHTGDASAVLRAQLPQLYALARALAGDNAEDVVQECLLKAYRRYHTLADRQAAPAWTRQILRNCVRDRYRRELARPREQPVADVSRWAGAAREPLAAAPPGHDAAELLGELAVCDIWAVLDRLPARHRIPLVLVHMEGLRTRDVAARFGVAPGTVLSWLHRGRQRFKRELAAYAHEHGLATGALTDGQQLAHQEAAT